jgi:UPF0755 protein
MYKIKFNPSLLITKCCLCMLFAAICYVGDLLFIPAALPNSYQLTVKKHANMHDVAQQLVKDKIITNPYFMVAVSVILAKDTKLTTGVYMLKESMSLFDIILRITNGHPDIISITILENWSFSELRKYIDSLPTIKHITMNMTEQELLAVLKIPFVSLEGTMYPDTYFIMPQQSDLEIYRMAYQLMQRQLTQAWLHKNTFANNYKNPYELLIMASLIQKETANPQDMYLISTVFNNRLRLNIRLQNDPAVFYGLQYKAVITRADFKLPSKYNTYLNKGLPPTPIAIPSQHALDAAASPGADLKLMYFVATNNGRTQFSYTFDEHIQKVQALHLHKHH